MNELQSSILQSQLGCLDIELSGLAPNNINSWFDTDCDNIKHLLNWLSTLDETNILQPTEQAEYEQLLANGLVLSPKECDKRLRETVDCHEEMLDLKDNLKKLSFNEEQLSLLTQQNTEQKNLITLARETHEEMYAESQKLSNDGIKSNIRMKDERTKCLTLAEQLDSLHEKLQESIVNYGGALEQEQHARPVFLLSMDATNYKLIHNRALSYLDLFQRDCSKFSTCTKSSIMSSFSNGNVSDIHFTEICELQDRIKNSGIQLITLQLEEEKLKLQTNFRKNNQTGWEILINRSIYIPLSDTRFSTKQQSITSMKEELEAILSNIASDNISRSKYEVVRIDINNNKKSLENLTFVIQRLNKLLSYQKLIQLLCQIEYDDVKDIKKFFGHILQYIEQYLKSCERRCEAMLAKIDEYKGYQQESVIERCVFLKELLTQCLAKDLPESLTSATALVVKDRNEQSSLVRTVFHDDCFNLYRHSEAIESNIRVLEDMLRSGATSQCLVIPNDVMYIIKNVESYWELKKKELMLATEVPKTAKREEAKDKWAAVGRQLWIYFITEPSRVIVNIQNLQLQAKDI